MRETAVSAPRRHARLMLVPVTEAERQFGLNGGVPSPYSGMVFNFDPPRVARMTMEETPQALQISFVTADRIVRKVVDAPPYSGLYQSDGPVRWVIESAGPFLRVGDKISFV